jgi:hypothetical protein
MHSTATKNECKVISVLDISLESNEEDFGSGFSEEFVRFHAIGDHASCPGEEMEDYGRLGRILRKLEIRGRTEDKGLQIVRLCG